MAGKACQQDIVIGNVRCGYLRDVSIDLVPAGEIVGIGSLRVTIPFAGEHATPAQALEGQADAANAGKKVDEGEGGIVGKRQLQWEETLQAKCIMRRH